jgi:hypothetical protein
MPDADELRRALLVCPYEDCPHPLANPSADDCGNHEEWMT